MSGYMMLIYIAQIQNIPENLLESARIDGASSFQCFWKIKLPLMMPAFTIGLFLTLTNCFKLYDQNLTLTGGGPAKSEERFQELCLDLQKQGANNINLVTPTHYVPQIVSSIQKTKGKELKIPIVYNTSSYENVST